VKESGQPTPEDILAIEQVLLRYTGGIDRKDYELFRRGFTPDVHAEYGDLFGPFERIEELATFMEVVHRDLDRTLHQLSNFTLLDFDGERARMSTYIDTMLIKQGHPKGDYFHIYGIFTEELSRHEGEWRVRAKSFDPVFFTGNPEVVDLTPATEAVSRLAG
jgi:SnoaL-like domain